MWDLIKKVLPLQYKINYEYIKFNLRDEVERVTTIHKDLNFDKVFGRKSLEDFLHVSCSVNNFYFLKNQSNLTCYYCEKKLVIYNFHKFNREDGATVDHMKPKSKGGSLYSFSNLCVCCHECNVNKADMEFIEWIKILIDNENKSK